MLCRYRSPSPLLLYHKRVALLRLVVLIRANGNNSNIHKGAMQMYIRVRVLMVSDTQAGRAIRAGPRQV